MSEGETIIRKFRFHRGTLEDSMATMIEVANLEELRAHVETVWARPIEAADLEIKFYAVDERIDWPETWLVTWQGQAIGYTDGPVLA